MSRPGHLSRAVIAIGVVIAAALGAGVAFAMHAGGARDDALARAATAPPSAPKGPPTTVIGLPSQRVTDGTRPLTLRLSGIPAPTTPRPWFEPHVNGTWTTIGDEEVFTPASTLDPCRSYAMTIPANTLATGHTRLGHERTVGLHVSCPPVRGLQLTLARLGYLPYSFRSRWGTRVPSGALTRGNAASLAFHPPSGRLVAHAGNPPPVFYGSGYDEATIGALEIYQSDHNLTPSGVPNTSTWDSLLAAEMHNRGDPHAYTWVSVDEATQTLEVHRGHRVVLTSPANTGVAGAPTAKGIFPIYERFTATTMKGTNPDGSHYNDPGVPWVNYFNGGDAVHGFQRASYGSPQSDGCVELPIGTAHTVYDMLRIGDIVWVR